MRRAAIYARYSSDLQSLSSIDDQIRLCRERIDAEGDRLAEVYSDAAISGGALRTRPGMLSLLADAQAGRFDLLIAEALDRISRDQEDVAGIYKRLSHAGVTIVTLAEGEISELHIGLKGTMNALFLKDLAQKTRRGQRGRVEAGKIAGGNSYGYRVVRRMLADGTPTTGEREIAPKEAAIVRRIFEDYAAGQTPRRIAAALNTEGIPGPRGGPWNASTINGSRQRRNGILNNELYIGRLVWNRQRFDKDPETGRRTSRPNPESEWVTADVPELRIVDDALWDRAQALKARYASWAGNRRQTKKRLLSGLVRCGACGGAMTIVNRERYSCSARRERGTCESPAGIQAADLETRVLNGLRRILVGNERFLAEFKAEFDREAARLWRGRSRDHGRLRGELAEVERGIERCLDFIVSGDAAPATVRDKLMALERRKTEIDVQLSTSDVQDAIEIHPNFSTLFAQKVGELGRFLESEDTRSEAMEAIRSLIDRIEVSAGARRGQAEVVLFGALAGILTFASPEGTGRSSDVGRVLLVAGAGFEPATFRL